MVEDKYKAKIRKSFLRIKSKLLITKKEFDKPVEDIKNPALKFFFYAVSFSFIFFGIYVLYNVFYSFYLDFINNIFFPNFLSGTIGLLFGLVFLVVGYNYLIQLDKRCSNPFIWISLFLIMGFWVFGNIAVENIYPSTLQFIPPTIFMSLNNTQITLSCKSSLGNEVLTSVDSLQCNATFINNNDFTNLTIQQIQVNKFTIPIQQATSINDYCPIYNKGSCTVYVIINSTDSQQVSFTIPINFINGTSFIVYNSFWYTFTPITNSDYNIRQFQKNSLRVGLIIGSIFSVFSAVKNMMEIWDRKRENYGRVQAKYRKK